jgi:uncharacterized protein (DUF1330 family)
MQARGVRLLADGGLLELEGPWTLDSTRLAYVEDDAALARLSAGEWGGGCAYAVEGLAEPGAGNAFVIAAHRMLDAEAFRPYADAIPDMLQRFGVRSLARGGKVTPLAGGFAPDRAVVLEFANVEAVISFYTSDRYAPLLDLRLRTTDPRFVVVNRAGPIPETVQHAAEAYLHSRQR